MFRRGASLLISNKFLSSQILLSIWLIYVAAILPLTLTADYGRREAATSRTIFAKTSTRNASSSSDGVITPTPIFYNCPAVCQCEYISSSQNLIISCSPRVSNNKGGNGRIDLSGGVRTLRIAHAFLNTKSISGFKILPTLVRNSLVELDLEYVSIDPKSFFTSSVFQSEESLRKISIKGSSLTGDNSDIITAANFRGSLEPFALLKSMDSLNICDSSPSLATIILQAMPPVTHLRAVNNSLYEIPYETWSPSTHQYSLQSVDFSKNHLSLIPTGLLNGLEQLKILDVTHNRIYHLQEQVFSGLNSLLELNVSHNQIEYVDAEVFTPLRSIRKVDISYNNVVQFFEPYFAHNKELEQLNMANMWVAGTFTAVDTADRSLIETERLINSLTWVFKLDISYNGMKSIPETLAHAPNLRQIWMDGNKWECSCQDRWFLDWVATTRVSIGDNNSTDNMWCFQQKPDSGETVKRPFNQYLKDLRKTCTNPNIIARTHYKYHAVMGKSTQLYCHAQKPNWPKITWITPSKQYITTLNQYNSTYLTNITSASVSPDYQTRGQPNQLGEPRISADGSLRLTNVTGKDYGLYICIASYENLNITHYVHLGMDVAVFRDVRLMSILVGWIFSFSFLAIVLLFQLVQIILNKLGVRCVVMTTTKQTRRVRAFFDSMEQHKTTQLDWLRENYNDQAKKIKDNCYSQLERIRESYSNQSKNLGEIRDYGTQQLHTLRDQYNDQVRKVANYSAHQLCKVRENYVFKRNQVCKFSSHKLLRIRETYKWQAQTLNKILENLPRGLNFDTCRGMGACGRTDSIYLDDMGEDLITSHQVEAEVYQLSHGSLKSIDKMEHVSLLIPSEFVNDYRQGSMKENDDTLHDQQAKEENQILAVAENADNAGDEGNYSDDLTISKPSNLQTVIESEKELPVASTSASVTPPAVLLEVSSSALVKIPSNDDNDDITITTGLSSSIAIPILIKNNDPPTTTPTTDCESSSFSNIKDMSDNKV